MYIGSFLYGAEYGHEDEILTLDEMMSSSEEGLSDVASMIP